MWEIFSHWVIPAIAVIVLDIISKALTYHFSNEKNNYKKIIDTYAENTNDIDCLKNGMRALIRNDITHQYFKWTFRGYCPCDVKQVVSDEFKAYKALGGNGATSELYEELMELPLVLPTYTERK